MTDTGAVLPDADPAALPPDTPREVRERARREMRVPEFDPTLGIDVPPAPSRGTPPHRFVAIGDSLTHGFQSGAIFNTDLSYPAIVAAELGWSGFRYPRYGGLGGLPFNIELLLRELEDRFGAEINPWELPFALFAARDWMDRSEDYWERGPGATPPVVSGYVHALAVYGWDLRDALSRTAETSLEAVETPRDDFLSQVIEHDSERAALRVYPLATPEARRMTLFDVARALGEEHGDEAECGIETLVVCLGANNALGSVTDLRVAWSGPGYSKLGAKNAYTVWRPSHFAAELDEVRAQVEAIGARHVIWCTVPHVTIAPVAKGIGSKLRPGSRYFPFYTRPWVAEADFDPRQDAHITGAEARAVDYAIDLYNEAITDVVRNARSGSPGRSWYLLDICGLLDRLAARRFVNDPNARPAWWTPYPLPPLLRMLDPAPDSRFLTGNAHGGRATGGLFSLDGVHPTTVAYGLVAQEIMSIMDLAGVQFRNAKGSLRSSPVSVDFARLIRRDTLVRRPPQNLRPGLQMLGWADETLDLVRRALGFKPG
jgi:hypothetical protein